MRISQQFFVRLIIQDMFNLFTGLQFYEDLQELLELTRDKDVIFIIGDWNEKVGSQEIPEVTGKFGLGVQNEGRKRLL